MYHNNFVLLAVVIMLSFISLANNKKVSFVLMYSFVSSNNSIAKSDCTVKNSTYIKYSPESINVDLFRTDNGNLIYYMHITQSNPASLIKNGIEGTNMNYKDVVIDAVNNYKSLSICLDAAGNIYSATINGEKILILFHSKIR